MAEPTLQDVTNALAEEIARTQQNCKMSLADPARLAAEVVSRIELCQAVAHVVGVDISDLHVDFHCWEGGKTIHQTTVVHVTSWPEPRVRICRQIPPTTRSGQTTLRLPATEVLRAAQ